MGDEHVPAVGIDLGTVFSVVAYLDHDGKPCTIPNAEGDLTTPSVVLFDPDYVVVGKEAVKAACMEPERSAAFAKRDMGEAFFNREIGGEQLPPEVVQSLVLRKVKSDAELMVGPFEKVVITVPAYFNEPRRKATQDAGRLAGLDVIDIINEPTAAAIAFGVRQGYLSETGASHEPETILVYDLGGGTFDVTVMAIEAKSFETVATAGDVYLGGIDWDSRIVDFVAEKFMEQHDVDPRQDPHSRHRLMQESEDAKRTLSAREEASINCHHGVNSIRIKLTRRMFEELTAELLDRTRFTAQKVLRDAGVQWSDLTRILLVGGSTRMPMVKQMLEKESGLRIDRSVSVDEAVAHGAAIYAGILLAREAGELPDVSVTNVNSHDLGVLGIEPGTGRPRRKVLIPRNTRLPATHSSRFVTHTDGQKSVAVPVIEGGDASGNNSTPIGKCVVINLPKDLKKGTTVVVNFTYTEDGRLTVSASLPDVENAGATMTIERASGLDDEQLDQWRERIEAGLQLGTGAAQDAEEATSAVIAAETAIDDFIASAKADDSEDAFKGDEIIEDTLIEDADATMAEDADTIEDAVAAGKLSESSSPEEAKPKKKAKPKKSTSPKKKAKPEEKGKTAAEDVQIEGIPPVEDPKIDPDDDALGDFLGGLP